MIKLKEWKVEVDFLSLLSFSSVSLKQVSRTFFFFDIQDPFEDHANLLQFSAVFILGYIKPPIPLTHIK